MFANPKGGKSGYKKKANSTNLLAPLPPQYQN